MGICGIGKRHDGLGIGLDDGFDPVGSPDWGRSNPRFLLGRVGSSINVLGDDPGEDFEGEVGVFVNDGFSDFLEKGPT
ncbi:MAG: hypothetical protein ACJAQT_005047 [Akkermansiaceae bacterium]